MSTGPSVEQLQILRDYSAGKSGTRDTIERLGFRDYGDLLVALAQTDLPLPKPPESPRRDRDIALATEILQPLLRREP